MGKTYEVKYIYIYIYNMYFNIYKSNVTLKTYQIFHQLNCKEQLHHILIRMFKMSGTICWGNRNRIQHKTQQQQ